MGNACAWRPSFVRLIDGREVPSDSEEWRHECEARAVLSMLTLAQRRQYLFGKLDALGELKGGVQQQRGKAATRRLENTIMAIWNQTRIAS